MRPADFTAAWRDTSPKVSRFLLARGLDHDTVEDAVQETGIRAFVHINELDSAASMLRWSCKVAHRVAVDQWRRSHREELGGEMPEGIFFIDDEVDARVTLVQVVNAFSQLHRREREAILTVLSDEPNTNRDAVRRHRARAKLMILAKVGAVLGALRLIVRHRGAATVIAGAATVVVALALLPFTVNGGDHDDRLGGAPHHNHGQQNAGSHARGVSIPHALLAVARAQDGSDGHVAAPPVTPAPPPFDLLHPTAAVGTPMGGSIGTRPAKPGQHEPLLCLGPKGGDQCYDVPSDPTHPTVPPPPPTPGSPPPIPPLPAADAAAPR